MAASVGSVALVWWAGRGNPSLLLMTLSSGRGCVWNGPLARPKGHQGWDIYAPVNTPVVAKSDGTVADVRHSHGYGRNVSLARLHTAAEPSMRLLGQVFQEQRVHRPLETDVPVCVTHTGFRAFMRQAVEINQLTAEHAPPEFAGGRAIALTCAACNHTAGSKLDSHASIAARYEDDPPGVLRDQRVRVALGRTQVNMTLEAGPEGMQLIGDVNRNSPAAHAAFFDELNSLVQSGDRNWTFNLQFRAQYDPSRAAVSWLRAAYIAAFAKFGYRLILDGAYKVVRQKIQMPSAAPSLFSIRVPQSPKDARALVIIREPTILNGGVAALMGRHFVLLPRPGDLAFYDKVKGQEGRRAEIRGEFLPWPRGPEFFFDFGHGTAGSPDW